MDKIFFVIIGAIVVVFLGTFIMFTLESGVPGSQIKTPLDALWWTISTVTTVGYGDVLPVTDLGRIVAMVYMGFGITMISVLLSVITSNFYKRRIEKEERLKKDHEQKYLRELLLNKIEQIEEKQTQSNKVILQLYDVLMKNNDNYGKP